MTRQITRLSASLAALTLLGATLIHLSRHSAESAVAPYPSQGVPRSLASAPNFTPAGPALEGLGAESALDEPVLTGAVVREDAPPLVAEPHQTFSDLPASELVYLSAKERVSVPLSPFARSAAKPIKLRADHGGLLNGAALSPQIDLPASATEFTFQAGAFRGLYTVAVSQGNHTEILEFWVGAPSPLGRPGPARSIVPPVATGTATF